MTDRPTDILPGLVCKLLYVNCYYFFVRNLKEKIEKITELELPENKINKINRTSRLRIKKIEETIRKEN